MTAARKGWLPRGADAARRIHVVPFIFGGNQCGRYSINRFNPHAAAIPLRCPRLLPALPPPAAKRRRRCVPARPARRSPPACRLRAQVAGRSPGGKGPTGGAGRRAQQRQPHRPRQQGLPRSSREQPLGGGALLQAARLPPQREHARGPTGNGARGGATGLSP